MGGRSNQIFDMQSSFKALRADGVHAVFYQKNQELVGMGVCDLVHKTFSGEFFSSWLKCTHLVLIPKIDSLKSLQFFCHISLCMALFKIVTKTIVNCLQPFLPKWVYPNQIRFVLGRSIIDNLIIVQEFIHSM